MNSYVENCNKTSPVPTNRYAHADSGVCKLEPACEARVTLRAYRHPPCPRPKHVPPIPAGGAFRTPIWCILTPGLTPMRGSIPLWHSVVVHTCRTRVRRQGQRHQLPRCCQRCISCGSNFTWSRGVTVSTLDSESSDRGSNPRGTSRSLAQASIRT